MHTHGTGPWEKENQRAAAETMNHRWALTAPLMRKRLEVETPATSVIATRSLVKIKGMPLFFRLGVAFLKWLPPPCVSSYLGRLPQSRMFPLLLLPRGLCGRTTGVRGRGVGGCGGGGREVNAISIHRPHTTEAVVAQSPFHMEFGSTQFVFASSA